MSTDDHDKRAAARGDKPVTPAPPAGVLMPVTRLFSRPSVEVINGRLVAVLELCPRAA